MSVKIGFFQLLICIHYLFIYSKAANYIYSDDSSKEFTSPGETQIRSSTLSTTRFITVSISHQIKGSYLFIVGIKDFYTFSPGAIDMAIYNTNFANSTTPLKIEVYPNTGLRYLSYHVMVLLSGNCL